MRVAIVALLAVLVVGCSKKEVAPSWKALGLPVLPDQVSIDSEKANDAATMNVEYRGVTEWKPLLLQSQGALGQRGFSCEMQPPASLRCTKGGETIMLSAGAVSEGAYVSATRR